MGFAARTPTISAMTTRILGGALLLLGVLVRSAAAQCAMCGTAVSGEDPLARGILWSVIFLISLPYTIVGAFIVGIAWAARRARFRREHAPLRAIPGRFGVVAGKKESAQ